ncbi:MAG: hypothetical protein ACI8W7_000205 [Gammaproteobacteria bacterium]|jgi:hypothetical protein
MHLIDRMNDRDGAADLSPGHRERGRGKNNLARGAMATL